MTAPTAPPPVVEATRHPGRLFNDPPTWRIRRCPFCQRPHRHLADLTATRMVVTAKCSKAKFYEIREGALPREGSE
jgi:hypothetical protein